MIQDSMALQDRREKRVIRVPRENLVQMDLLVYRVKSVRRV